MYTILLCVQDLDPIGNRYFFHHLPYFLVSCNFTFQTPLYVYWFILPLTMAQRSQAIHCRTTSQHNGLETIKILVYIFLKIINVGRSYIINRTNWVGNKDNLFELLFCKYIALTQSKLRSINIRKEKLSVRNCYAIYLYIFCTKRLTSVTYQVSKVLFLFLFF